MTFKRLLRAHLVDHPIALHFIDGARGDADVNSDVAGLPGPIDPGDGLLGELSRPARRQPGHARPAELQVQTVAGRIVRDERLAVSIADQELMAWATRDQVVDMRPLL